MKWGLLFIFLASAFVGYNCYHPAPAEHATVSDSGVVRITGKLIVDSLFVVRDPLTVHSGVSVIRIDEGAGVDSIFIGNRLLYQHGDSVVATMALHRESFTLVNQMIRRIP